MGIISDSTNTRWGKYRPFLLYIPMPYAIIGVPTFTSPDFRPVGKIIDAYVTYSLMMMIYTAVNVH